MVTGKAVFEKVIRTTVDEKCFGVEVELRRMIQHCTDFPDQRSGSHANLTVTGGRRRI